MTDMNSGIKIISSQRGGEVLLKDGYRYTKRRVNSNGHVVWRCSNRKVCSANLVIGNDIVIKLESHKCKPNVIDNEVKSKIHKCIQKAENETTPIPTIYSEVVEEFNDAGYSLIKNMPPYKNLKQVLYRRRHKALQTTKTQFFKTKDVVVPGKFNNFLLADYNDKNCRIILFASSEAREVLRKAKHVFLDGTFKSASPPFTQLYTIHVDMGSTDDTNGIIPVIYALLPNKKQKTYEILLEVIKSQIPDFQPDTFTLDYEASAMSAIENIFPNAKIQGCLFHFARCLWRKYEQVGMKKSTTFRSHVKRCIALAHLPKDYLLDGWLYTKGECVPHEKMSIFNEYFEKTWIKSSSFYSNKWCFNNINHRTNNAVESWNARLNRLVNPKPNIATLINTLQKDSKYYFGLFKQKGFISKKTQESLWRQQKIDRTLRELVDNEISLGHCIEKICNL